MSEPAPALDLPAQAIPIPSTISPQARAFLASATRQLAVNGGNSSTADLVAGAEAALKVLSARASGFAGECETVDLGHGAKLYHIVPAGLDPARSQLAYLDVHGGAFVAGGGEMCRILAQLRAMDLGVQVWAVDYRLAPDHPYPAALDDCMAAYRHVLGLHEPSQVIVAGGSAGGNLVAAMLLRARDESLPMPAGLIMMTPVVDMTGAGDTRMTNRFLDVTLYGGGGEGTSAYVAGGDPLSPYLSPILGEFTRDWPPTLLSSGTRDLLLSDTVRMHRALRRAGIRAELHVAEAGPHGGFMGTAPEDHELIAECRRFCDEAWGLGSA
nr:putative esterase [uncultured bacterium]